MFKMGLVYRIFLLSFFGVGSVCVFVLKVCVFLFVVNCLTEYVQVEKEMLKEILREIGELKQLAMSLSVSCSVRLSEPK